MKARVFLALFCFLAVIGPPALADEGGAKDTVDMVVTIQPDSANGILKLQLELWVFDDADTLNGASMGFGWDNPKLQMTNAVAEQALLDGFTPPYFYDSNNIDSTNERQRFQLAGLRFFTPGVWPHPNRQLWATYYFEIAPDWTTSDVIHIDTFAYNSGTKYKFISSTGGDYFPFWMGALEIHNYADTDNDGIADDQDNCQLQYNPGQEDDDFDDVGNLCDNCSSVSNNDQLNSDGDSHGDACDNCPSVTNEDQFNSDGDDYGNVCDNCPSVANNDQLNSDGDSFGDACDNCVVLDNGDQLNSDGDDYGNACDNCPNDSNNNQVDSDGDGFGDACDLCPGFDDNIDNDDDLMPDACDNCPTTYNPDQANSDGDSYGNACDNCPTATNEDQADSDGDGAGNACDLCPGYNDNQDADNDNIPDSCDNCPTLSNSNQADSDGDGVGNVCDNCSEEYNPDQLDNDGDNKGNACDNCPDDYNPNQEDNDGDNLGDICDPDDDDDGILDDGDNSGVIGDYPCAEGNTIDCDDNCPFDYNPEQEDADGDGVGEACQTAQSERYVNMKQWRAAVGGNDHWYAVLPESWLYEQADSVVRIPEKEGWLGGHLATITSQEENDFVMNNIIIGLSDQPSVLDQFWMGGYNESGSIWKWITGEPLIYTNWAPQEPNNGGIETIIMMWGYHETHVNRQPGTWNNAMPDRYTFWSLVEWEGLFDNDLDGIAEEDDNCPEDYNPDQVDTDSDGLGDVCDDDDDGDDIYDWMDNCPLTYNPTQSDSLGNGVGDACRSCCVGLRGNADCSPDGEIDISDITMIINLLYLGGRGQEFCCLPEADVDDSGGYPDISDITKIIRYLYLDHEILPECPLREE